MYIYMHIYICVCMSETFPPCTSTLFGFLSFFMIIVVLIGVFGCFLPQIINTLQVAHTLGAGADSSSTPWIGSHIRRVLEEAISLAGTAASMGNSTQSDHTLLLAVAATCVLCEYFRFFDVPLLAVNFFPVAA